MNKSKRQGSVARYMWELGTLVGALVLCRVRVGQSCAPFGLAMMAAAELCAMDPLFPGAGVLMGAFLSGEPLWGVMIGAAAFVLLVRIMKAFLGEVPLSSRMLVFLLSEIAVLPFQVTMDWSAWAFALLSLALSAVSVVLMVRCITLLRRLRRLYTLSEGEQMLLAGLLGLMLLGIGDLSAVGISLPVILLDVAVLLLVSCKGPAGLGEGIILAAMLAFGLEAGPALLGVTALSGLLAALVMEYGRVYGAGAFLLCVGMMTAFLGPEGADVSLGSALIAGLTFLVLPGEWLSRGAALLNSRLYGEKNGQEAMARLRERTAAEVEEAARLCGELSSLFDGEKESDRFVTEWPLGAARRVCDGCEGRVLCRRDEGQFERTLLNLLSAYDRGDPVRPLPPMDSHCKFFREIMTAAYQSYNQAFAHEAGLRRAGEQYAYMNRQLCGVSAMLSLIAGRLREDRWGDEGLEGELIPYLLRKGFSPLSVDAFYTGGRLCLSIRLNREGSASGQALVAAVERKLRRSMRLISRQTGPGEVTFEMEAAGGLKARMASASLPERAEQVSGDETGELRMPCGRVVFAVSDGMGSGEEANRESRAAIGLLFDQFRLGVERELIYENVNRLLIARGEKEIYATLDAASIDLATGEAEMVKFGAPPTCLLRAGNVRTLTGEALPCGIVDEARPYIRRIRLKKRDRLVFCTDGVYDLLGRDLEAELKRGYAATPEQMAQTLLEAAARRGQRDDMTVMVVEVA